MLQKLDFLETKLEFLLNNKIVLISTIIIGSFILRLYFSPFGIPLTLDGLFYFWYASDVSILGKLPNGYTFANNGWPMFIAPFFAIIKLNSMISYMDMQRIITIVISVLTTIPVYYLCRRFTNSTFAVLGATVFAFEPRLIQNSLLGLNDSLYILLGIVALVLFLKADRKTTYVSFAMTGFASLVRSEGLFLFFTLSAMYFVQHRKSKNDLIRYSIVITIFTITVLPIAILRIEMTGTDALTGRIINEAINATTTSSTNNNGIFNYVINTLTTFFGFLGRVLIPIFIFFVPIGAFLIFRNITLEKIVIILTIIIMSLPALYAYSIPALDTKYLYFLYPLFCVLVVLAVQKYGEMISKPNIVVVISIIGVLSGSVVFLNVWLPDRDIEAEYFEVAQYITNNALGVNHYYPESRYLIPAELAKKWPIQNADFVQRVSIINTDGFNSLEEYIRSVRNERLTHIVIDDKENRPLFLKEIFLHEGNYPFLTKVFDSRDHGYKYHVKIYKIEYSVFDEMLKHS